MLFRLGLCLSTLMVLCLDGTAAEAQEAGANSFRFNQPIPVTIRRSNNSVVQTFLVGIDATNVTVANAQGRQIEYPNNTVRSVRSNDGSFFYSPAKDNLADVVQRLNQAQPATNAPGQPGIPGQPGATSTVPFTVSGANPQPGAGHSQPGFPGNPQGNNNAAQNATNAAMAQMMAHSQANANRQPGSTSPPAYAPGAHSQAMPSGSPSPMPGMPMPMGGHNQSSSPAPGMPGMPMGGHSQTPSMPNNPMPGMNTAPQMQMQMEYECSKCKHRFTSPVEIKAGHKCAKCGVIWGQVQDQNGNVTSSSPGARIGGGVGIVVVVIGIIAAIVRKVNASS